MAIKGVHTIAYAFKNVKMVTSEVDPYINEAYQIEPGFGDFADRYFGTELNTVWNYDDYLLTMESYRNFK